MGRDRYRRAVVACEKSVTGLAEAGGGSDDGVKDGLQIGRRARDHPQNFGRGRLLLERLGHLGMGLGERAVLLLQFREQPHVLDGNDGLVGEGLHEGDLRVGEEAGLLARQGNGADAAALPQHRSAQLRPILTGLVEQSDAGRVLSQSAMWTVRASRTARVERPGRCPAGAESRP